MFAARGRSACVLVRIPPFLLPKSPILAQFGEGHGGVDWNLRPLAYGRLSIWERSASDGRIERPKRRHSATAIGDDDRRPTGGVTNPAPCFEVQFADRDRLHVQIVMHFSTGAIQSSATCSLEAVDKS